MKFLAMLSVVIMLALSVFAAPPVTDGEPAKGRLCAPGKSYFDGCNECWCGFRPTKIPYCTYMGCPGKPTSPAPEDFWLSN